MRTALTPVSIALFCCSSFGQAEVTAGSQPLVKEIAPIELRDMLGRSTLHVIDVNEEDNYNEAHVPGAKRMDYDAITAASLTSDKKDALVFYCWSPECPAAEAAAETAAGLGFAEVYCMHAGITGWQDAGLPTEP